MVTSDIDELRRKKARQINYHVSENFEGDNYYSSDEYVAIGGLIYRTVIKLMN